MFRIFPLVCLLSLLFPLTAAADDVAAPATAAMVCDGRYAAAGKILQAMKYGTLYSGGDYWHVRDDVGQTVDMYRLWRSLPDWQLREAGNGDAADEFFRAGGKVSFDWLVGNAPENSKAKAETAATVFTLDINAAVTRPADAWLDDERTARLSPLELWLRFVMAASDAPWANIPIYRQDYALEAGFLRLRDEALRRYHAGEGIEWAVAAQLLDPLRPTVARESDRRKEGGVSEKTAALDKIFADWQEKVLSCAATPQEYAAWAAVAPYRKPAAKQFHTKLFQSYRNFLPDNLFRQWVEYWSRWSVITSNYYNRYDDNNFIVNIAKYIANPDQLAWLDAGLSFSLVRSTPFTEKDMDELLAYYKGRRIHPITAARFNMLSPEHLLLLAREGELSQNMRCGLISAAFARYVTDGENAKAFTLIEELLPCFPENTRKSLAAIVHRDAPLAVKNALFALNAPLISTWVFYDDILGGQGFPGINAGRGLPSWLVGFYGRDTPDAVQQIANRAFDAMTATEIVSDYAIKRDLPQRFVTGEKFTQDRGEWLQHPDYWEVFHGMRGYSVNFIDRIISSSGKELKKGVHQGRNVPIVPPLVFENSLTYLVHYSGGNGFTHAISITIIRWAETEEKKWFMKWFRSAQDKAAVAEALGRVVRMNKYNDGGRIDGKPVGQRALWLLQRNYPNSEAAKTTRYWYQARPALNW